MPSTALSEARIRALKPRDSAYDIRDAKLRGFGVRVLPSGARRFFIHSQHRGERFWKIVGDANTMRLEEARACAISTLGAIRRGENASDRLADARFEGVAAMVFERKRANQDVLAVVGSVSVVAGRAGDARERRAGGHGRIVISTPGG